MPVGESIQIHWQGMMMNTISEYLGADHERCDALFADLETELERSDWARAGGALDRFRNALFRHFAMEETILFLAFEEATGSSTGPTAVMRMEHAHIRGIVDRIADSLARRDVEDLFGHADTLRIMMLQHNLKEESILYLMTDRVLAGRSGAVIEAMDAVAEAGTDETLILAT